MASLKDILLAHATVPSSVMSGTPVAAMGTRLSNVLTSVAQSCPVPAGLPSLPMVAPPTRPKLPTTTGLGRGPFGGIPTIQPITPILSMSSPITLAPGGVSPAPAPGDSILQPARMQGGRGAL